MFNNIAPRYDFLNHFLSMGIDILWRKRLIRELRQYAPALILDMATGTGDLAMMAARAMPSARITGIDLSSEMIAVGVQKSIRQQLDQQVTYEVGDAEDIHHADETFDAAMVAFGVRNFADLSLGLREIGRVLKPGQPLLVLEFSQPGSFPMKQLYHFYSFSLLPLIGKLVSKDPRAYTYLPESIRVFPSGHDFIKVMENCGFTNCRQIPLSARIASIYIGHRKSMPQQ
ncbi:MAG: bifunctional demethylmenaquinone methyltransferase/2-methoxy-6-polyprenyl-1,4-benzoquinol methylase UbiE [Prolixibacteraceae bacterium]|nr:bifunctional demethylmenaquinone methyltransferase/2-methoxy-6-polyprenyl-1,4-benzoquinol methylase UbiE [Prolixibacteraceae bacterium]